MKRGQAVSSGACLYVFRRLFFFKSVRQLLSCERYLGCMSSEQVMVTVQQ